MSAVRTKGRDVPRSKQDAALIRGFVLAVAEMIRAGDGMEKQSAEHALRGAGITRELAIAAGAEKSDIDEIPWGTWR